MRSVRLTRMMMIRRAVVPAGINHRLMRLGSLPPRDGSAHEGSSQADKKHKQADRAFGRQTERQAHRQTV